MKPRKSILKKIIVFVAVAAFWVTAWWLLAYFVGNGLILPTPVDVFKALCSVIKDSAFAKIIFSSVISIFKGFVLGQIAGILLAVLTAGSKFFKALLAPLMGIVKATPIASFIILVLIWLGKEETPAFIAFLIVLPTAWQNVQTGILTADKKLLEVAEVYEFGFFKKVRYVFVPSIMPYFVSAFKIGLGMAWKAGVAAEVLCAAKDTLGGEIYYSKIYLEVAELFAWTVIVIVISMLVEYVLIKLINAVAEKMSLGEKSGGELS